RSPPPCGRSRQRCAACSVAVPTVSGALNRKRRFLYPTGMAIRALLFDLDNTLWYFPVAVTEETLHHRCAEQIAPLLTRWAVRADAEDLSRRIRTEAESVRR